MANATTNDSTPELTVTDRPETAPPEVVEDVTELIVEDHQRLRLLFLRLEDVREDLPELTRRWEHLASFLELHASSEEEVFYPHLLRQGKGEPEEETDDAIGDHNEIREAIHRAAGLEVGSAAWWKAVHDARSENSEHLHEEETEALPDYRANSSAQQRSELARAWRSFREAHPAAEGLSGREKDPQEYIEQNS